MDIYILDVGTIDNNYVHYMAICTTKHNNYWFRGSTWFDPWPDPLWPKPRVRQGSGYRSGSLTKLWPVQVWVTEKSLVNRPDLNNGNTSTENGRRRLRKSLLIYSTILSDFFQDICLGVHFRLARSDIFLLLHNTTTGSFNSRIMSIVYYYYLRYINTHVSTFLNSLLSKRPWFRIQRAN